MQNPSPNLLLNRYLTPFLTMSFGTLKHPKLSSNMCLRIPTTQQESIPSIVSSNSETTKSTWKEEHTRKTSEIQYQPIADIDSSKESIFSLFKHSFYSIQLGFWGFGFGCMISDIYILKRILKHLFVGPIDISQNFLFVLLMLLLVIRYVIQCLSHFDVFQAKLKLPMLKEFFHLFFFEPSWHLQLFTPMRLMQVGI